MHVRGGQARNSTYALAAAQQHGMRDVEVAGMALELDCKKIMFGMKES